MIIKFNQNPVNLGFRIEDENWLSITKASGVSVYFRVVDESFVNVFDVNEGEDLNIFYNPVSIFSYNRPIRTLLSYLHKVASHILGTDLISSNAVKPSSLTDYGPLPFEYRVLESQVYESNDNLESDVAVKSGVFIPAGKWIVVNKSILYVAVEPIYIPKVLNQDFEEQELEIVGDGVYKMNAISGAYLVCSLTR